MFSPFKILGPTLGPKVMRAELSYAQREDMRAELSYAQRERYKAGTEFRPAEKRIEQLLEKGNFNRSYIRVKGTGRYSGQQHMRGNR